MLATANAARIPLADGVVHVSLVDLSTQCYNNDAQTARRMSCLKATFISQSGIVGRTPSVNEINISRYPSEQRWQTNRGRFASMIKSKCKHCGKEIVRRGSKAGIFCDLQCKGIWQAEEHLKQMPVTKEWLYQKYVKDELSTYSISEIVKRDPKTVYKWLIDFGIPTRQRGWETDRGKVDAPPAYWCKEWLYNEYVIRQRSTGEIADDFGVTFANIRYFMNRFGIPRRNASEARRLRKFQGFSDSSNPMYGVRGSDHPGWKGGCTPERQEFYRTQEWTGTVKAIWKRDKATCQRCGRQARGTSNGDFHIHHIVSFAIKELRAKPKNLILLCASCHHWVHSNENTEGKFIKGGDWNSCTDDSERG